jgi:hypothetical protein
MKPNGIGKYWSDCLLFGPNLLIGRFWEKLTVVLGKVLLTICVPFRVGARPPGGAAVTALRP